MTPRQSRKLVVGLVVVGILVAGYSAPLLSRPESQSPRAQVCEREGEIAADSLARLRGFQLAEGALGNATQASINAILAEADSLRVRVTRLCMTR